MYYLMQLRAGNGGANPAYGNPDKRPVFWPQHYWPWERLNDVHSRPRGMEEPLNYSEMMKLAIARGYRSAPRLREFTELPLKVGKPQPFLIRG